MVYQGDESPGMSSENLGNPENVGETAVVLISVGSVLVILCAATIIYGLRRRRHVTATMGGSSSMTETVVHNPTDYMNSLATWDPIDAMLDRKKPSAWTLEVFENYGSEGKQHSAT